MNSVLNNLTYCDGRFDIDARATFSDSPSRLKLRSNTFQGIRTSLEKRKTPAKANGFIIPSFALPQMQVEENETQGGSIKDKNQDEFTYRNISELENVRNGASKKLKVGQKQHDGLVQTRDKHMEEVAPQEEVSPSVEEVVPVVSPMADMGFELPKVEVPEAVNMDVVPPVVDKVEMPTSEEVKKDEEVPEVKAEDENSIDAEVKEESDNSAEEQMDEFSKLQKVTEKYEQAAKEYDVAKEELDTAQKEMQTSKQKLETTEREISDKENELTNQRNVIDTTRKDIAEMQEKIDEVREEIKRKTHAYDKAREKKVREKKELESKTKQAKETNAQYQQGIEANNKTLESLEKESQELTDEENKVLNEKANIRSELERVEEILKAITLPEGAEEHDLETSKTPSIVDDSQESNFIPFQIADDVIPNEESFEKTLGSYKAA